MPADVCSPLPRKEARKSKICPAEGEPFGSPRLIYEFAEEHNQKTEEQEYEFPEPAEDLHLRPAIARARLRSLNNFLNLLQDLGRLKNLQDPGCYIIATHLPAGHIRHHQRCHIIAD